MSVELEVVVAVLIEARVGVVTVLTSVEVECLVLLAVGSWSGRRLKASATTLV